MLLREQCRRHQQCNLPAAGRGDECRAHRDLGLAEADIAADHAIHWLRRSHVAQHCIDCDLLIGCFLERKARRERFVHRAVDRQCQALPSESTRLDFQQLGGDIAHALGCFSFRFIPLLPAQRMQWRGLRRRAAVAADQMQLRDWYVEFVALRVFDLQIFVRHAASIKRDQALVATDAVVLVHDRRADRQRSEIAHDRFGIASGATPLARMRGAFGIELTLGEDRQRWFDN